jgi:6,7-dimethyl-8-ribityllumazine synthase
MQTIEGNLIAPPNVKFALVAARFNDFIVAQLIAGASDALIRHGVDPSAITVVRVPGAWEMGPVCQRLGQGKRFDAIVALGAVIRGGTPHFDYVAGAAAKALEQVAMETSIPVGFGLLTTDSIEQAIERAGTKAGNKGADAALAALEMVNLGRALDAASL